MKLLFDQNISFRITKQLDDRFKECRQVRQVKLEDSDDMQIWQFAKNEEFTIVTFDADFYDISLVNNYPPKIIWLRTGNITTKEIASLLATHFDVIREFIANSEQACLEIE